MITLHNKDLVKSLDLPDPKFYNSRAEAIKVYGNPGTKATADQAWAAKNLISINLPYPMKLAWDIKTVIHEITVHRFAADLGLILQDVYLNTRILVKAETKKSMPSAAWDAMTTKKLSILGLDLFGGCYNHRATRGSASLSAHAFGCAIDIDPERNPLGSSNYHIPDYVIKIFEAYGWTSGAKYKKRPDPMHFSRLGF